MEWKYYQYIKTGWSKTMAGKPCQDAVTVKSLGKGSYIAVVADGVGGFEYSEIAAEAAVNGVVSWVESKGEKLCHGDAEYLIQGNMIPYVRQEIERAANRYRRPINEMDCNLAFAYVRQDYGMVILGQLGDNAVCIIGEDQNVFTSPGLMVTSTESILARSAETFKVYRYPISKSESTTILLTTDGLDGYVFRKASSWLYKDAENLINPLVRGDQVSATKEANRVISALVKNNMEDFEDDISIAVLTNATRSIRLLDDPEWLCICGTKNHCLSGICSKCNTEFSSLYCSDDFRKFGGREGYLRYFNQNPDLQKKLQPAIFAKLEEKKRKIEKENEARKENLSAKVIEREDRRNQQPKADSMEVSEAALTHNFANKNRERQTQNLGSVGSSKETVKSTTAREKLKGVSYGGQPAEMRLEDGHLSVKGSNIEDASRKVPNDGRVPHEATGENRERTSKTSSGTKARNQLTKGNAVKMGENKQWVQDPETGAYRDAVTGVYYHAQHPAYPPEPIPQEERHFNVFWMALSIFFVALIVVLAIVFWISRDNVPERSEREDIPLAEQYGEADIEWLDRVEGDRYYGAVAHGYPHGFGSLWIGDECWIGTFDNGVMTGIFQVVTFGKPQDYKAVFIKEDGAKETLFASSELLYREKPHKVVRNTVVLREKPEYNSAEIKKYERDDILYILDSVVMNDKTWVRVISEDGHIGWCDKTTLEPAGK